MPYLYLYNVCHLANRGSALRTASSCLFSFLAKLHFFNLQDFLWHQSQAFSERMARAIHLPFTFYCRCSKYPSPKSHSLKLSIL